MQKIPRQFAYKIMQPVTDSRKTPQPAAPSMRDRKTLIGLGLLVVCALGHFYNSLALVSIAGFAITLPLILFTVAAGIGALTPRTHPDNDLPLLLCVLLIGWQIVSAVALGIEGEFEWLKSVAQFILYATCFALSTRIQISRRHVAAITPLIIGIMGVFGGLGIIEYVMLNTLGTGTLISPDSKTSGYNPAADIYRTDGVMRPAVFAIEPSTYSMALSVAAILCIFCCRVVPFRHRTILGIASLLMLGGSIASISPSGWIVGIGTLVFIVISEARLRQLFVPLSLLVVAITPSIYSMKLLPVLTNRVDSMLNGSDNSTNVRVFAALELMFREPTSVADFVVGYGLGMETSYRSVMGKLYGQFDTYFNTNINNIFTVVQITQGWGGMALHIGTLLVVMNPAGTKDWSLYFPLSIMIFLLHFASGYYLEPIFWAQLSLVVVLRNANFQPWYNERTIQVHSNSAPITLGRSI